MIQTIIGAKGSGKTKKIIDLANKTVEIGKGMIVYLSVTARHRMEIKSSIRFIDVVEEKANDPSALIGFIKGMINANYDIEYIFIDGIYKMLSTTIDSDIMKDAIEQLKEISEKSQVHFIMTVSCAKEELPEFFKEFEEI